MNVCWTLTLSKCQKFETAFEVSQLEIHLENVNFSINLYSYFLCFNSTHRYLNIFFTSCLCSFVIFRQRWALHRAKENVFRYLVDEVFLKLFSTFNMLGFIKKKKKKWDVGKERSLMLIGLKETKKNSFCPVCVFLQGMGDCDYLQPPSPCNPQHCFSLCQASAPPRCSDIHSHTFPR